MKILLLITIVFLSSCATTKFTQEAAVEACAHSKPHHDIAVLGLTDKALEPTSMHIHCNCPYGFPYNNEEMRCKTKAEIEADRK